MTFTLGIVGHEAKKFTQETEFMARSAIRQAIVLHASSAGRIRVVSGACPLGGIDVWAIEEADKLNCLTQEFPPAVNEWDPGDNRIGFKQRNEQIARASDHVICIVVRHLPKSYNGRIFANCYHCGTTDHIKSGGCWTRKFAERIGKTGQTIII